MAKRAVLLLALVGGFVVAAAVDLTSMQALLNSAKQVLVTDLNWFFTGIASIALPLALWIGLDPRFNVRLGPANVPPAFGRWSWFAMLFSAGLASGLIYWATAEPLTHFQANPHLQGSAPLTENAAVKAITLTVMHWGLHGWAFYALTGLAIAVAAYRHGQPLTFRSGLWPLLGPRTHGLAGISVDLIGVLGTIFGVATSVGLAVAGMNAAVAKIGGFEPSVNQQLLIVAVVVVLGLASVLSGIGRGIRRLSVVNLWLSLLLLAAVLIIGPTSHLLGMTGTVALDYARGVFPMALWTASSPADQQWQGDWTVFYWGWWLAWTPFVGLFIARISAGRTVREFMLGVLLVPTMVVIVWMSIFGGAALFEELQPNGDSLLPAVNADYSVGTTALIERLGVLVLPLTILVALLLFSWLITSLDSATLVICHLLGTSHTHEQPVSAASKCLWSLLLGLVTAALMLMGGINALQAASIVVGVPVGLVLIATTVSLIKALLDSRTESAQR